MVLTAGPSACVEVRGPVSPTNLFSNGHHPGLDRPGRVVRAVLQPPVAEDIHGSLELSFSELATEAPHTPSAATGHCRGSGGVSAVVKAVKQHAVGCSHIRGSAAVDATIDLNVYKGV